MKAVIIARTVRWGDHTVSRVGNEFLKKKWEKNLFSVGPAIHVITAHRSAR